MMREPLSRLFRLSVIATLSTMIILSGCSSSSNNGETSKSAQKIFSDSERATESATRVHISGRFTSGGDKVSLDIVDAFGRSGGTVTDKGSTFQIVLSGKTVYIKGSKATMTKLAGGAAGQLLGGKWLETTTTDKNFGDFSQIFNLSALIQHVQPKGALQKDSVTTVDGQSVVGLTDTSQKGTIYVATTGRPYMIELDGGPKDPGTLTFNQYGSAKRPPTPTGAVNLDQLEGGTGA